MEFAVWRDPELLVQLAANDLLAALESTTTALNAAKRFRVPTLGCDSYQVVAQCDRVIARAKGEAVRDS